MALQLLISRLFDEVEPDEVDKQNLNIMWSTDLLAVSESHGASAVLERSVEKFMASLLAPDQERTGSGTLSEDEDPNTDPMTYSRSLSSLEVEHELTNRKRLGFSHKQCKILAPYFTYYKFTDAASSDTNSVSEHPRILSHDSYARAQSGLPDEPGFIDLSRHQIMSNCFYSISPEDANLSGIGMDSALRKTDEGSYAEDLQKLLRRISELQAKEGCPAPLLVPLFVEADGNCLAHSLSRCLCGSQV
jgi:hypothetical protein